MCVQGPEVDRQFMLMNLEALLSSICEVWKGFSLLNKTLPLCSIALDQRRTSCLVTATIQLRVPNHTSA